jgi:hypothetical protein
MNCKEGDGPCENRPLFRHQNSHLNKLKRKDQKENGLELWSCSWLWHQDNAFVHNVILVGSILANKQVSALEHGWYIHLAPSDTT